MPKEGDGPVDAGETSKLGGMSSLVGDGKLESGDKRSPPGLMGIQPLR